MEIATSEARGNLAEILNRVKYGKERVILRRRGKTIAAVVPVEDLQILQELEDHLDIEAAKKALLEAKEKGTVPWRKIKRELGL